MGNNHQLHAFRGKANQATSGRLGAGLLYQLLMILFETLCRLVKEKLVLHFGHSEFFTA
jgi:hypothetical protein